VSGAGEWLLQARRGELYITAGVDRGGVIRLRDGSVEIRGEEALAS